MYLDLEYLLAFLYAGLSNADGDYIATMDADL